MQRQVHPDFVPAGTPDRPPRGFRCEIPVRWSDQDANGHVNNARVVTLMEEARLLWLNRHAAAKGVESFNDPKFVAALTVDFLKPVSYGAALVLHLGISRIGTSSFTVSYEASQDPHTVFRASTVLVVIDRDSGRPRALHDEEIAYLTGYVTPDYEAPNIGETND